MPTLHTCVSLGPVMSKKHLIFTKSYMECFKVISHKYLLSSNAPPQLCSPSKLFAFLLQGRIICKHQWDENPQFCRLFSVQNKSEEYHGANIDKLKAVYVVRLWYPCPVFRRFETSFLSLDVVMGLHQRCHFVASLPWIVPHTAEALKIPIWPTGSSSLLSFHGVGLIPATGMQTLCIR